MRIPLTLRLAYHGTRSIMRAGLLFVCAWLFLVPANPDELAALGAQADTKYPTGLRPMRTARVIIAVAPERAYDLIGAAMRPPIPSILVQAALTQIASGRVLPSGAGRVPTEQTQSDRDITGPRFIQIE